MNVRLLKRVRDRILAEPAQFVMEHYFASRNDILQEPLYCYLVDHNVSALDIDRSVPNCGTAACIAGWTYALSRRITPKTAALRNAYPEEEAAKLLGISERQAERLFLVDHWPGKFYQQWQERPSLKIRARIAARRIDHFIKTRGEE